MIFWNTDVFIVMGAGAVVVEGMPSVSEEVAVAAVFVDDAGDAGDAGAGAAAAEDDGALSCAATTEDAFSANAVGTILNSHDVPDDDAVVGDGAGVGAGAGVGVGVDAALDADVGAGAGAGVGAGADVGVGVGVELALDAGAGADETVFVFAVAGVEIGAGADVFVMSLLAEAGMEFGEEVAVEAGADTLPESVVDADGAPPAAGTETEDDAIAAVDDARIFEPVDDEALPSVAEEVAACPVIAPSVEVAMGTASADPPPAAAGIGAMAAYQERTSDAARNCFASRSAMFVCPEKFPQNICACPVENTAELSGVNAAAGAPGGRSGAPSAFWTLSHEPRHDEG